MKTLRVVKKSRDTGRLDRGAVRDAVLAMRAERVAREAAEGTAAPAQVRVAERRRDPGAER